MYYSREISELHLDPDKIFNTGCFVINRSILDVLTYDELISTVTNSAKSYDGGDQGYLNFIVQNSSLNLGKLPLRFNYPLDTNYPYVWRPPSLIHFSGEKPWSSGAQILSWDLPIYQLWNSANRNRSNRYFSVVAIWLLRNIRIFVDKKYVRFKLFFISLLRRVTC